MLKILKSSARDTVIYSIGTFASKLTGLILVRIYTNEKFLSSQDFGVLNLAEANLQIIATTFGLGLSYAYERWYWDKEQIVKRKSLFFTLMSATVLICMVLLLSLLPFSDRLSKTFFESTSYSYVFELMLICACLEMLSQTPNTLIRLNERPGLFTLSNIAKLMLTIGFTLYFIVFRGLGLAGIYYAQMIGVAGYFLILSPFLLAHTSLKWEFQELKDMIRFRMPLLLPIIALNIFNFNDRFMLSNIIGLKEAGIYSLGAKLANTIKVFLITAIWLALTPTIYKMMNDPQNKRFYSKLMTYLSFAVILFVMAFSFFSKEMVTLFAKDDVYLGAYRVIPIVSLGIFFGLLKDVSMIGLNITKRTGAIASITLGVTAANLLLNYLLIPALGIEGAATAGLLAQVFFFILIYKVAQSYYPIPYELGKIFLMVALAIVLHIIATFADSLTLWVAIPAKLFILGSFPFLLYLFRFYEAVELERLSGFL
jgi:O-antigen/teichoic acid export membrane protein